MALGSEADKKTTKTRRKSSSVRKVFAAVGCFVSHEKTSLFNR